MLGAPATVRSTMWRSRLATRRHPRVPLALKAAIAAAAAWLLVQPLGGFVDRYPFYAPLGAVVAMSRSVVGSVRRSAQAVAGIAVGASVGLVVLALPGPEVVALALGIAASVLLAGLAFFGPMGSWVPIATLFELIASRGDPWNYAAAYLGLTALGACVGLVANLVLPQLPLTPAAAAQDRLRAALADQLDLLAEGLADEDVLEQDDWAAMRLGLEQQAREVEELAAQAEEARRGSWVARRWAAESDRGTEQARALQRLTGCVDEVVRLVGDARTGVHADDRVAAEVRTAIASAMRAVAVMLRSVDHGVGAQEQGPDALPAAVRQAERDVVGLRRGTALAVAKDDRYLAAAAIAVSLEQAVDAWC